MVGKDTIYIRNLQRHLDLHIAGKDQTYSQCHLIFIEKIVALRAFHIPLDDIKELFETEKRILKFLHMDTLTKSPDWYLDGCDGSEESGQGPERLLLSGFKLGFPVDALAVQQTLDFGARDPELFKSAQMGEDLRRILRKYIERLNAVKDRIEKERPILENALHWARGLRRESAAPMR